MVLVIEMSCPRSNNSSSPNVLLTHQKYDAVLITAYKGTMNKIRTISGTGQIGS